MQISEVYLKEKISSHEFVWNIGEKGSEAVFSSSSMWSVDSTYAEFSHVLNQAKNWDLNQALTSDFVSRLKPLICGICCILLFGPLTTALLGGFQFTALENRKIYCSFSNLIYFQLFFFILESPAFNIGDNLLFQYLNFPGDYI